MVRLDFGAGDFDDPEHLPQAVLAQLDAAGEDMGVATRYDIPSLRFQDLLKALHVRTGRRVVVLVDEYDKPILDTLERREVARANRDFLRGLYGTIKSSDAHVRFTLLTGVSKFSKVSLFSGLNNLQDITLDPRYATICGYAETDLDAVFAPELPGLDRNEVRDWYDGYGWAGAETVYNPFDILLLFDRREFGAYWFETGTPAFLLDTLVSRGVEAFALDDLFGSDELLSSFDMDDVAPEALLFQTGYLTIREVESGRATRATTRACSMPASRRWVWTCGWRTARTGGGWIWPCCSTPKCICSSSRWRSGPPRVRRWRSCSIDATRTSTAA